MEKLTEFKEVQPLKVSSPILRFFIGSSIDVNDLQFSKAPNNSTSSSKYSSSSCKGKSISIGLIYVLPIARTFLGIFMEVNEVQPEKAPLPIF